MNIKTIVSAIVMSAAAMAPAAHASKLCLAISELAEYTANYRDQGVSKHTLDVDVYNSLDNGTVSADTAAEALTINNLVYSHPDASAEDIKKIVYIKCTKEGK